MAEHRSQARASQASLHFPSRRDFIEGFDTALPGGVDSVVQVRHHAGVVGDDGDEFTNSGLSRSQRRAHMSVLLAEAGDFPIGMLEDTTETFKPQQIGRQALRAGVDHAAVWRCVRHDSRLNP